MNRSISFNGFDLSNKILIGIGLSVAAGSAGYLIYRNLRRETIPVKWRRIGTLHQINIFPIKSCAPMELCFVDKYYCDVLGLSIGRVLDRQFMLINKHNEMITARGYPHMLKIQPKASLTGLICRAPGMPDLYLDFEFLDNTQTAHTSVWGVDIDVMLCGPHINKWFSEFILNKQSGLKLVYYPYPVPMRATNPRLKSMPFIKQTDSGTLHDATSYMLMNLSSVNDLNSRLKTHVEPLQFRGNFHLKMDKDEPYAEDQWQWIRIGNDTIFRVVAPCTRCILPNINIRTAQRDVDGEPLKTLRSYRLFDYASPAFGIHLGLRHPGKVTTNDVVFVEEN